jgi:hypothetical protein
MEVSCRELPNQCRQNYGHAEKRQRQPVRHQHEREVIIMHRKPVAEGNSHSRRTRRCEPPQNRGQRQNYGGKRDSRDGGNNALRRNPAG